LYLATPNSPSKVTVSEKSFSRFFSAPAPISAGPAALCDEPGMFRERAADTQLRIFTGVSVQQHPWNPQRKRVRAIEQ
jgi:hypothetical protein